MSAMCMPEGDVAFLRISKLRVIAYEVGYRRVFQISRNLICRLKWRGAICGIFYGGVGGVISKCVINAIWRWYLGRKMYD